MAESFFAWIEVWYERRWRHSTLGNLTLVAHEEQPVNIAPDKSGAQRCVTTGNDAPVD